MSKLFAPWFVTGALQAVEVQTRQGKGSFNTFVTTPTAAPKTCRHEVLSQVTSFRQKSEAAEILVLCSERNTKEKDMSKTRKNSDLNCETSDCLIKISAVAGAPGPGHRSTSKWRRAQAAKRFIVTPELQAQTPNAKLGFPGQKWTAISFPEMKLKADYFDPLAFLSGASCTVAHAFPWKVPTAEFDNSFHASQHNKYTLDSAGLIFSRIHKHKTWSRDWP